jgi:hypothetical protein
MASCGRDIIDPPMLSPCTGPITPSVSNSRFSWTPVCGLSEIVVIAPPTNGGPQVAWDLKAGGIPLMPGIDYGVAPSGATSVTGPAPAQHGVDYHVAFNAPGLAQPVGDLAWTP